MNTPNQYGYSPFSRRDNKMPSSNASSKKCECCKGPLINRGISPLSGLSYFDKQNQLDNEGKTPQA
jgi:hypothetical protein